MPSQTWDRAAAVPIAISGRPRAEVVSLPTGAPDVATLFSFMRDAERRFDTLRMRIVETTATARGDHVVNMDIVVRHVGQAKVTTSEPQRGPSANYEIWASDGDVVRAYVAARALATERPVRDTVAGFDGKGARDLPGRSRFYEPVTALPMETLADLFVHPAGYLQNVLATGSCRIVETERLLGRETIGVVCEHPRASEVHFDRPDVRIDLLVDRATGVILGLTETVGEHPTRQAETTEFSPDAVLPASAFDIRWPPETRILY